MSALRRAPVGSRRPTPDQGHEGWEHEDEVRVQRSMTAHLHHYPGTQVFTYWWHLRWTRWSRPYNRLEQAVEAMRQQGFGAYVDLEGNRVRLR